MAITIHRMELNYLVYLRCLNNFRKYFPTSHQKRESHEYLSANFFAGSAPTVARLQCFRLLFARILKTAVLSAPVWQWEDTQPTHVWCLSDHSKEPRVLWNGMTVIDQKCLCVLWLRWNIFWAFVLNLAWKTLRTQLLLKWERVF